ncbi:hypothetical protein N0V93_009316 [Gnomoniopsis smithogilvyi]|uniref:Uncharacterized protein n=1 Tax=Gnomoniopsis smithogilvyi TaxID=1191159 RepID=A0A9W8YK97_9PEZI|nr:hypothetical protein N0V93_009316 [Gnomoniopsis smithogilvyi]
MDDIVTNSKALLRQAEAESPRSYDEKNLHETEIPAPRSIPRLTWNQMLVKYFTYNDAAEMAIRLLLFHAVEEALVSPDATASHPSSSNAIRQQGGNSRAWRQERENGEDSIDSVDIIKHPETRPIFQEQLVAEVKGLCVRAGMMSFNPAATWEAYKRILSSCYPNPAPALQYPISFPDFPREWEEERLTTMLASAKISSVPLYRRYGRVPIAGVDDYYPLFDTGVRGNIFTDDFSLCIDAFIDEIEERRLTTKGASAELSSVLCHIPERRYLPVSIAGVGDYALPDTGVRGNVITYDYALSVGAVIDESQKREFKNARKQAFGSLGTTRLDVSLTDDPTKRWTCNFDVVETLAAPLVLGNQFLEMAGIFKTFAHRLVKKALSFVRGVGNKTVYTFMHMGSPRQKLGCFLDDEYLFADVDSGSHLNFVSPDLFKAQRLDVIPLLDEEAWVMLADGELVKLEGYVETTLGIGGDCIKERFHVLEGLSCDAVIGDPTIESLDLFNKFSYCLIGLDLPEERDNFYNIAWVETSEVLADIEEETNQLLGRYNASTSATNDTGINSMRTNASSIPYGSGSRRAKLRKMLSPSILRRNQAPSTNVGMADVMNHLRHRLGVLDKTWRECVILYNKQPDDERDRQKDQYSNTVHDYDRIRTTLTGHIHALRNPV